METGFEPVYNRESKVLILGSFPSVKSRSVGFYYGNPQNRFWRVLSELFHENVGGNVSDKINFLLRHGIALWDIARACEIQGSSDSKIRRPQIVDLNPVLRGSNIRKIILNGKKAGELYAMEYGKSGIPYRVLPSTSPANVRFDLQPWREAFKEFT